MTTAEQIALSAAHAAWVGALASTCASIVALGIAVSGARREARRQRRLVQDQETAFCFAMVGALEMIKPLIVSVQAERHGASERRRFIGMVEHARTLAEAGLAMTVFDMQMLRDAYRFRGVLNYLRALPEDHAGAIPNTATWEVLGPSLDDLLDADDRFFARLPQISRIQGISGRTVVRRSADGAPDA